MPAGRSQTDVARLDGDSNVQKLNQQQETRAGKVCSNAYYLDLHSCHESLPVYS